MAVVKILNDESPMPLGKFRGTKMANVPYWYLLWYEKSEPLRNVHDRVKEDDKAVRAYIADVKDWLLAEQKQAQQNKRNSLFDPYQ